MKIIIPIVLFALFSLMFAGAVGTVSAETIKELFSTANDIYDY